MEVIMPITQTKPNQLIQQTNNNNALPVLTQSINNSNEIENLLNKYGCHYNWNYDDNKFGERREKNLATCLNQVKESVDPTVYNFLGFLYVRLDKPFKAEQTFLAALELVNDEPVALANLANFCYQQGREKEAREYLEKLAGLEDKTLIVWQAWSQAYLHVRLYEYPEAIIHYEQAIQYIEALPELYRYNLYLYKGIELNRMARNNQNNFKRPEAIEALKEALTLNQTDQRIYYQLGDAYANLQQNRAHNAEVAFKFFTQALALKPLDPTSLKFYAKFLVKRKKVAEALKNFDKSIQATPTSSAFHNRGILYRELQKYQEAQKDLEQAFNLDPFNIPAIIDLINIYEETKQYGKALNLYQQLSSYQGQITSALLYKMAEFLIKSGNAKSAVEKLEELLNKVDTEQEFKTKAKEYLTNYYHDAWINSDNIDYLIQCIQLYLKFNDIDKAYNLVQGGLKAQPDHFLLNYLFGSLLVDQGKYQESAGYLYKAFMLTPDETNKTRCFNKIKEAYLLFVASVEQTAAQSVAPANPIKAQLEAFKKQAPDLWHLYAKLEAQLHSADKPLWHRNFSLFYRAKKPHKGVLLEGEAIHKELRATIKEKHQLKSSENLNYANAKLSFIVSDRTHQPFGLHGRKVVSIPVLVEPTEKEVIHVTNCYPFFKVFLNKNLSVWRSQGLLRDVLVSKPIIKHDKIIEQFDAKSQSFHRDYHCSERALYAFLNQPKVIDDVIDTIEVQCNGQQGLKIYAMIIDIHTDRYLCNNCEESVFFWYAPKGEFMEKLIAALEARGHKTQTKSGVMDIAVRVSAEKPAYKQSKCTVDQHDDNVIDIKANPRRQHVLLMQRDDDELKNVQLKSPIFTNLKK